MWFRVLHPKGCAPTKTHCSRIMYLWSPPLVARRTLSVYLVRTLLANRIRSLQRGVVFAPSALFPLKRAQHRSTSQLQNRLAWVCYNALGSSVALLGSELSTVLVLACYAVPLLCCAVIGLVRWCCVMLRYAMVGFYNDAHCMRHTAKSAKTTPLRNFNMWGTGSLPERYTPSVQ